MSVCLTTVFGSAPRTAFWGRTYRSIYIFDPPLLEYHMHGNVPWKPQHEGFLFLQETRGNVLKEVSNARPLFRSSKSYKVRQKRSLPNYNGHIRAWKFTDYLEIHPGRKAGCPARLSGYLFRVNALFHWHSREIGGAERGENVGQSRSDLGWKLLSAHCRNVTRSVRFHLKNFVSDRRPGYII